PVSWFMPSFAATITIAPITTRYVVATDRASRVTGNSSTVLGRAAHKRDPSHVQRPKATHRQPQETHCVHSQVRSGDSLGLPAGIFIPRCVAASLRLTQPQYVCENYDQTI